MKYLIPQEVISIGRVFNEAGFDVYLVGGCVRDLLMDVAPKDWDITTNAKPEEMQKTYLRAMEKPIPPKIVSKAPVKEVILTGDKINLYDLPQILHHQEDAGAYITAAISFAKDPNGDTWNCAYNRLMIKGRDTTSIHLTLAKHLWEFQREIGRASCRERV